MKTGTFIIAHTIREQDPTIEALINLHRVLERNGVKLELPKLGFHISAITPFRASEETARLVAWMCDYWDTTILTTLQESDRQFSAYGTKFDFFRSPDKDAFIIRLKMNEVLGRAIERGRKKIPDIAEYVYPPVNYDFNPHITIGEGQGVYEPIAELIERGVIKPTIASNLIVRMEPPKVLRKNGRVAGWSPVW